MEHRNLHDNWKAPLHTHNCTTAHYEFNYVYARYALALYGWLLPGQRSTDHRQHCSLVPKLSQFKGQVCGQESGDGVRTKLLPTSYDAALRSVLEDNHYL